MIPPRWLSELRSAHRCEVRRGSQQLSKGAHDCLCRSRWLRANTFADFVSRLRCEPPQVSRPASPAGSAWPVAPPQPSRFPLQRGLRSRPGPPTGASCPTWSLHRGRHALARLQRPTRALLKHHARGRLRSADADAHRATPIGPLGSARRPRAHAGVQTRFPNKSQTSRMTTTMPAGDQPA
jgi:hypothetical protein